MTDPCIRVLLVEDDEDDYLITRDLLDGDTGSAYQLTWASTYRDGLAHIQRQPVDVCLIDYRIGERTGLEFVQEVLAEGVLVPMILLTGTSDRDIDLEATRAGASDYLDKSELSATLLERSIRYALRHVADIAALTKANEELEKASIQLEAKVVERTRELAALNESLRQEVEEHERTAAQVRHDAFHDRLTQLPNRELLLDRVNHAIRRSRRSASRHFAILLLSLDRFQTVNDSLGHAAGDEFLLMIASRLSMVLRSSDTAARIGGKEFACLIEDVTSEATIACAQRIKESLAEPIMINAQEICCTASIGIALSNHGYVRAENMLHDASLALHSAKSSGKDRYSIFEVGMRTTTGGRLKLESDLRGALKGGDELEVYYQPIIALPLEKVAGFEALIRWTHPERGPIGPNEFVPIAEETGLIVPMGRLVLERAARTLKHWHVDRAGDPPLFMSVNISPRHLIDDSLVHDVRRCLVDANVPPRCLKLEITESMLMADPALACEVLQKLKALDVGLSIDDFGTGYSSLSYLRRFPFDVVKIDRSLIRAMTDGQEDKAIVATILNLAEVLNMTVIAEGLETRAEVDCLSHLGCELVQGFYFARPMPFGDADVYLSRDRGGEASRVVELDLAGGEGLVAAKTLDHLDRVERGQEQPERASGRDRPASVPTAAPVQFAVVAPSGASND